MARGVTDGHDRCSEGRSREAQQDNAATEKIRPDLQTHCAYRAVISTQRAPDSDARLITPSTARCAAPAGAAWVKLPYLHRLVMDHHKRKQKMGSMTVCTSLVMHASGASGSRADRGGSFRRARDDGVSALLLP